MLVFLCNCVCVCACELWNTGREGIGSRGLSLYFIFFYALLNLWVMWSHARLGGRM